MSYFFIIIKVVTILIYGKTTYIILKIITDEINILLEGRADGIIRGRNRYIIDLRGGALLLLLYLQQMGFILAQLRREC